MGLFQTINLEARNRKLEFLVIGGLAVNFHGYSRDSADLHLLIRREAREQWLALFAELDYSVDKEKDAFIQLSPPKDGAWPVDLMMVREPTSRPMFENGKPVEMFGARLLIPCLEHLLALKLHALKHSHLGRYLKDFLDVENLVRVNKVDRVRIKFANYLPNMAQWNCMKKYPKPASANDSLKETPLADPLEFPVAPDFVSRPPRINPQVMLRRIEETMSWRNKQPGEKERRLAEKISVEFVL